MAWSGDHEGWVNANQIQTWWYYRVQLQTIYLVGKTTNISIQISLVSATHSNRYSDSSCAHAIRSKNSTTTCITPNNFNALYVSYKVVCTLGKRVFAIDYLRWIDIALWSYWKIQSIDIDIYSTLLAIHNIEWIDSLSTLSHIVLY